MAVEPWAGPCLGLQIQAEVTVLSGEGSNEVADTAADNPKDQPGGISRRRGRRSADSGAAVRAALIDAARSLCIEVGFDSATTKSIARRAGVNPAMINYYFGSKEGLGQEMMRVSMQPIIEQHDAVGKRLTHSESPVADFVDAYMTALSKNPWLPQLIVREVLPANGRFREVYFQEFRAHSGRMLEGMRGRVQQLIGRESGIDPGLVLVSLASLVVFPFLASPVIEGVLGVKSFDDGTTDKLIAHTKALLAGALGEG